MKSIFSRAVIYSLIILFGLLSALPNLLPDNVLEKLPEWYAQNQITLGLDLRGDSHLLMEVDTDELLLAENQQLADQITTELRTGGFRYDNPNVSSHSITLRLHDRAQHADAARILHVLIKPDGTTEPIYELSEEQGEWVIKPTPLYEKNLTKDAVERSLEVVRRRLNETGLVEPLITRQGADSILVQLPGVDDPQHIRQLLGTTAQMTFHWVANDNSHLITKVISLPGQLPSERHQLEERVALEGKHVSTSSHIFYS